MIKNIYTLWGRKRFLLPVTYFPTNLVYPFTLRVTGIITQCRAINRFLGKKEIKGNAAFEFRNKSVNNANASRALIGNDQIINKQLMYTEI